MKFSEYIRCDATALRELVASGAVSPDELLKCALEQSARANPKTNVRISAIVDACFRLIVDGVSAPSWTRRGCAQARG
jgi:Asp-tRNA(Asn)/Glu-tRNA(Gln) amidotransferase A subunit family amidase